jgi:peptidyl-prolyl cis-trans isomerase SurA
MFGSASLSRAQETEVRVIDEVVAQVNDGVITLSRVKRELKMIVDSYVAEGKPRAEAQRIVEEKLGELIANLINEELLIQRSKELGLENDIEASLNQRFIEIMKQYGLKTVEALYAEMEKSNIDPKELRETWRKQATRDRVIQREVFSKLYWQPSAKELRDYFEKNKSRFTKPETVSVSELFLGYAGRNEADVKAKARQISEQLKNGADFDKIVKESGDPGLLTQGTGKAEKLPVKELMDVVAQPLKGVRVGGYTEPFEVDKMGLVILRVDAREEASSESFFDENAVRLAMMNEKAPEEQKKFMAKLREDAYIKISDSYRPIVSPILFADERKAKEGN